VRLLGALALADAWRASLAFCLAAGLLAAGGCSRSGRRLSAGPEQPGAVAATQDRASATSSEAVGAVERAQEVRPTDWEGDWESKEFPGLALQVSDASVVGVYAGGQGHIQGEIRGNGIDFQYWRGATEFLGAPLDLRGLGSGALSTSGLSVKGTYTSDTAVESKWSMKRPGQPDEAPEAAPAKGETPSDGEN